MSKDCGLPPSARFVGVALAKYMDKDTLRKARPGCRRLADATGYSIRTVKVALAQLEAEGWITTVRAGGLTGPRDVRATEYAGIERCSQYTVASSNGATTAPSTVQSLHRNGATTAPHLVSDLDQDLESDGSWLRDEKGYVYGVAM